MLKLEFVDQSQTSFWIVDEMFNIGSSNKNQMVIPNPHVLPIHANVMLNEHGNMSISPANADAKILVNYAPVAESAIIHVGDVISLAGVELRLIDPSLRQRKQLPSHTSNPVDHPSLEQDVVPVGTMPDKKRTQPWKVKAVVGAYTDKLIDVNRTMSVGRDSSNEIVISGGHISRHHAELFVKNEQLLVRDLDSSNGTFVNGEQIKERAVYLGDEISFDSVVYRVAVGKAPPSINHNSVDKTQFRAAIKLHDDDFMMQTEAFPTDDATSPHMQSMADVPSMTEQNNPVDSSLALPEMLEQSTEHLEETGNHTYLLAIGIFLLLAIVAVLILLI